MDNLYAGCEEENKCCKILDIKLGVQILCVLGILGAVGTVNNSLYILRKPDQSFYGYLFIVCAVPSVIGAVFMVKFLIKDTAETRQGVVKGVLYNGVSGVATLLLLTVVYGFL